MDFFPNKREPEFMKKFTDVLSPMSWLVFTACFIQMYIVVFNPSFKEILIFLGAETFSFIIIVLIDRKFFLFFFPSAKPYFPKVEREKIRNMSLLEKKQLLNSLMYFPISRALYCALVSYPKTIPSALVITFVWQNDNPPLQRLLVYFSVFSVVTIYFYGVLFVEIHSFVSKQIAKFHDEDDWSELFSSAPQVKKFFGFEFQERLVLISIWIFILSAQWIILQQRPSPDRIAWQISIISISGILLVSRFLYISRNYFSGGLLNLVARLENFDPEKFQGVLPFHTSHILSQFEWVMNMLIYRLRDYRKQLSHWLLIRAEQTRVTALGEISALVVHDLGTPLHVISFCASQIREKANEAPNEKYLNQLIDNVIRSVELVESLRTYLRNGENSTKGCFFFEAFTHAKHVLRSQIGDKQFSKVKQKVDSNLKNGIRVNMAQADLIHVLHNLLVNAYEDLLKTEKENPEVEISLEGTESNFVTILISDNGSGLSSEKFEKLTSVEYREDAEINPRTGLGLRLVRALVDRYGGKLTIVPYGEPSGTTFRLKLPFEKESIEPLKLS